MKLHPLALIPAAAAGLMMTGASPLNAQDEEVEFDFDAIVEDFGWTREGVGKLKSNAEIKIPEGYRFTDASGAIKLMELYGNQKTGQEYGLIGPETLDWCVLFEFESTGYIKDDDRDELDADAMLKTLREGQEMANKQREEMGYGGLELTGWVQEPNYNEETNNLEWALKLRDTQDGGETVNYNTRLLGRRGVMKSILICNPGDLDGILPEYADLLEGFSYKDGHSYADYKEGDKIAKYGLTGLVAGGAAVAAWKFGGKFLKIILFGLVAVGVACKSFFARLFGRG